MPWAVIPAYNEATTVGDVVRAAVGSGCFEKVLVVDDGSSDGTAEAALAAGAQVFRLDRNSGKAEAMLVGVELCPGDIAFFDADLVGVSSAHIQALVAAFDQGYDMVCALRDYGAANGLQLFARVITGERVVRRWILDAMPDSCWRGFAIETALNAICDRGGGKSCAIVWPRVTHRNKAEKRGWLTGRWQNARMFARLWAVERHLTFSGDRQCGD